MRLILFIKWKSHKLRYPLLREKCPNAEFFLVRIFPVFGLNTERYGIWKLLSILFSDWITASKFCNNQMLLLLDKKIGYFMKVCNYRVNQFKNIWNRLKGFFNWENFRCYDEACNYMYFGEPIHTRQNFFSCHCMKRRNFRRVFALFVSTYFSPQEITWNVGILRCVLCYFVF